MDIPEEQKPSIIQSLLNERYSAEHSMRERSVNFTKWILGLGIALLWVLLTKADLELFQKLFAAVFVISYSAASIWFLSEICRGFTNNRRVIVKLESMLKFYEKDYYLKGHTIFPDEYKNSSKHRIPSHFKSLYTLIVVLSVFLTALIVTKPASRKATHIQKDNTKQEASQQK
jgi:hypothetical protein